MDSLILDIAKCTFAEHCLNKQDSEHPCFDIVSSQSVERLSDFQVPEPWSGQIQKAKILFVSSNPSIGESVHYPKSTANDEYIIDYFTNRFGGGSADWIQKGTHELGVDGQYTNVRFWSAVKSLVREIAGEEVTPGIDYALTEVVHCKSKSQIGVESARKFCSEKYLKNILAASSAKVIVPLGLHAKASFLDLFDLPDKEKLIGPVQLMGMDRIIAFLPHPNARKVRSFNKLYTNAEMTILREQFHGT